MPRPQKITGAMMQLRPLVHSGHVDLRFANYCILFCLTFYPRSQLWKLGFIVNIFKRI